MWKKLIKFGRSQVENLHSLWLIGPKLIKFVARSSTNWSSLSLANQNWLNSSPVRTRCINFSTRRSKIERSSDLANDRANEAWPEWRYRRDHNLSFRCAFDTKTNASERNVQDASFEYTPNAHLQWTWSPSIIETAALSRHDPLLNVSKFGNDVPLL